MPGWFGSPILKFFPYEPVRTSGLADPGGVGGHEPIHIFTDVDTAKAGGGVSPLRRHQRDRLGFFRGLFQYGDLHRGQTRSGVAELQAARHLKVE